MPNMDWNLYLEELGVLERGHFVLASGRHSDTYLEKAHLLENPSLISDLCFELAFVVGNHFEVETVVGPEYGGIIIANRVAEHLQELYQQPATSFFTQKDRQGNSFLRRAWRDRTAGKKVLVVDDILTTGGTVRSVAELVRDIGGKVCAIAVLCNRGGVTSEQVGGFPLFSLIDMRLEDWEAEDCPLCKKGIPITPR